MTDFEAWFDRTYPVTGIYGQRVTYQNAHVMDLMRAAHEAGRATHTPIPPAWISVDERLPSPGMPVIAYMINKLGNGRTVRAHYSPKHTVDASHWDEGDPDENEDGSWEPEGWWEDPVIGERLEFIGVSDGDITHWMPLPPAPDRADNEPDQGEMG